MMSKNKSATAFVQDKMTIQEIRQQKKELRTTFKAKRRTLTSEYKAELDKALCTRILESVSYKYADVVLMFFSTEYEIDILPVFEKAVKDGKRVAFPRCMEKGIMKFYYLSYSAL